MNHRPSGPESDAWNRDRFRTASHLSELAEVPQKSASGKFHLSEP
jgi:hypothetical protein